MLLSVLLRERWVLVRLLAWERDRQRSKKQIEGRTDQALVRPFSHRAHGGIIEAPVVMPHLHCLLASSSQNSGPADLFLRSWALVLVVECFLVWWEEGRLWHSVVDLVGRKRGRGRCVSVRCCYCWCFPFARLSYASERARRRKSLMLAASSIWPRFRGVVLLALRARISAC